LAALTGGTSKEGVAGASAMTARVSQDEQGVHLVLPKPAVELLGRLRPLLETFLKLAG
jgi:hypothetical protein